MSPARMAANTSTGSSSSGGTRRGGVTGVHGALLRSGRSRSDDPPQAGQVQHARDLVDVVGFQAEAAHEQRPGGGRHGALHLEADRRAEAATPELLLDREQQVVGLVLLDLEVGVAGDPEEVAVDDLHAR